MITILVGLPLLILAAVLQSAEAREVVALQLRRGIARHPRTSPVITTEATIDLGTRYP